MRQVTNKEKVEIYKRILQIYENITYNNFVKGNFDSLGICTHLQTITFENLGIYGYNIDQYKSVFPEFFKYEKDPYYPEFPFWWPISWLGILTRRRVLRTIIKKLKEDYETKEY